MACSINYSFVNSFDPGYSRFLPSRIMTRVNRTGEQVAAKLSSKSELHVVGKFLVGIFEVGKFPLNLRN